MARISIIIKSSSSSLQASTTLPRKLPRLSSLFLRAISPTLEAPARPWAEMEGVCESKARGSRYFQGWRLLFIYVGMYKDQIYFIGAIQILKNRHKINFTELYCGKINV